MRCISPHARYSIQVFEGVDDMITDARGYTKTISREKPVVANFEQQGLLEHEIEEALMAFNFTGLPEGVNPLTRVSVFDTETYVEQQFADLDDEFEVDLAKKNELQQRIDNRLRKLQARRPSEFIIVDQPAAGKPWPSYDEDSVEQILEAQERYKFNPETVRLYELEHEARPEITDRMTELEEAAAKADDSFLVHG